MRSFARLTLGVTLLGLVLSACDCVSGNPYDSENTPADRLARAAVEGRLAIEGCASAAGVPVQLVRLPSGDVADITTTASDVEENGDLDGRFRFEDVIPGSYRVVVAPADLPSLVAGFVDLGPGEQLDLGAVSLSPPTGSIEGEVELTDLPTVEGVSVVVVGATNLCGASEVHAIAPVVNGRFVASSLLPGLYEVRAAKSGYTVDRRHGLSLSSGEGQQQVSALSLDSPLVLQPASAVLKVVDDIGAPRRYVNEPNARLEVLAFGGMSEMRIDTDLAAFSDPEQGWTTFSALVEDFELGEVEGEIRVLAQFRDGTFITDIYETRVVLDTTPPEVLSLAIDGDAVYLSGETGVVSLEALDALSGIAGLQVSVAPLDDVFDPVTSAAGPAFNLSRDVTLSFADDSGAYVDGEYSVRARVIDGAGNVSDEVVDVIVRDTTPPAQIGEPAVAVANAVAGVLAGRRAELSVQAGADEDNGVDGPVQLLLAQAGGGPSYSGPFTTDVALEGILGDHGQSLSFTATVWDAAGNALELTSADVTLNLHGRVHGTVLLEGVSATTAAHGGTTVTATLASGTSSESTVTTADGSFSFDSLPEGTWHVRASRPGAIEQVVAVAVTPGSDDEVFFARLQIARGTVSAVVEKAGIGPDEDHGGVLLEISHLSGFRAIGFSGPDGSVVVDGVPERIADAAAGEPGYEVRASAAGYTSADVTAVSVTRDEVTEVASADAPLVLAKRVGDFTFCAQAPSNGTCPAISKTKSPLVYLDLKAENVTHVRIQEGTPFADPGDATDAAFEPFPKLDASAFSLTLSDPDGRRTVYVQFKDDQGDVDPDNDTLGPVLQAEIVLDRVPPSTIDAVLVKSTFAGSYETLTDADRTSHTNHVRGRVRLALTATEDASDGSGVISVRISSSADFSGAQTFSYAGLREVEVDPNETLDDGTHTLHVGFCDGAGNCTGAGDGVAVGVILDRAAPSAVNGVAFKADETSPQVQRDPADALDTEVFTTYVSASSLPVLVAVGEAPDAALDGTALPDVAFVRASLDPLFLGSDFVAVPSTVLAGDVLALPPIGLPNADRTYRVYLQLRDHAGNETASGPGALGFDVVLDTTPPEGNIAIDAAAAESDYFRGDSPLPVRVEATVGDTRFVVLSSDGIFDTETAVAFTVSPQVVEVPVTGSDGPKTVTARLSDVAGNVTERSVGFYRDTSAPTPLFVSCGSCLLEGDDAYSDASNAVVRIDALAAEDSGQVATLRTTVVLIEGGVDGSSSLPSEEPYDGSSLVTLSVLDGGTPTSADGLYAVDVVFVDAAGNESAPVRELVTLDRTPPAAALAIDDGAAYTSSTSVSLDVTASDNLSPVVGMRVHNTTSAFSGAVQPLQSTLTWTLDAPTLDGQKTVWLELRDAAGNVATTSSSVILDRSAPSGTVSIESGALRTNNPTVSVALGFGSDVLEWALTADEALFGSTCSGVTTWTSGAVPPTTQVTLASTGGEPESRGVYLCVRDAAGNAGFLFDTIVLDEDGPVGSVALNGGASYTTSRTLSATISAPADTALMKTLLATPSAPAPPSCDDDTGYVALNTSPSLSIPATGPAGLYTFYVCLKDSAGNVSTDVSGAPAPVADSIIFDGAAPTLSVSINGGAAYTTSGNVELTVSADDDLASPVGGVSSMRVANNTATFAGAEEPYANTRSWLLDNPTNDALNPKTVCVEVTDAAGRTASACDTITLDLSAPVGTVSVARASGNYVLSSALSVTFASADATVAELAYGESPLDCSSASYSAFTGSPLTTTVNVTAGDGARTVVGCFKAGSGLVSQVADTVLLDETDPAAPSLLFPADDTSVASRQPTFEWTSSAGATSYRLLVRNAVTLASVLEQGGIGTTRYTPTAEQALPQASLEWLVQAVKPSGRTSAVDWSTAWQLKPDIGAPGAPSGLTVAVSLVSKSRITSPTPCTSTTPCLNDAHPRLSFTASTDAVDASLSFLVELALGGDFTTPAASYPRTSGAAFSVPLALVDGTWSWRVTAIDDAGNETSSATAQFIIDRTPPDAPTFLPPTSPVSQTVETSIPLAWTDESASGAAQYRFELADGTSGFSAPLHTATQTGRSVDVDGLLTNGAAVQHYARVTARDALGNQSGWQMVSFFHDSVAPCGTSSSLTLEGSDATDAYSNSSIVPVALACSPSDASKMRVACDGTVDEEALLPFSASTTCALADGVRVVRARLYDDANNPSALVSDSITVDRTAPSVPRFSEGGQTSNSTTFTVGALAVLSSDIGAGLRSPGYELYAPTAPCASPVSGFCPWDGASNVVISLVEGQNRIRVRAVDRAENRSDDDQLIIVRDTVAPGAVLNLNADAGNGEVTLTWDPPTIADGVVGYQVFYGPVNGPFVAVPEEYDGSNADQGASPINIGDNTHFRLTGLPLGTPLYVAVRAYDAVNDGVFTRYGQALVPNEVTPKVMGVLPMLAGSRARSVAFADNVAYVGHGCQSSGVCVNTGFSSVDVSDPTAPVVLDTCPGFNVANDIAVLGNYAYLANGRTVKIVDVSDPLNLGCSAGSVTLPTHASNEDWGVALDVSPGHLYVAAERAGVHIYSLNNPTAPSLQSSFTVGSVDRFGCVTVQGDFAYACNSNISGARALWIINVSNKASPADAGGLTGLPIWDVEVSGSQVYAVRNSGTYMYYIGSPIPSDIRTADQAFAVAAGQPRDIEVGGSYLWVANDDNQLRRGLDVHALKGLTSFPTGLPLVGVSAGTSSGNENVCGAFPCSVARGNVDFSKSARLALAGVYLLEAHPQDGLIVRRTARPVALREIARASTTPYPLNSRAGVGGGIVGHRYLYGKASSVSQFDLSDPAGLTELPSVAFNPAPVFSTYDQSCLDIVEDQLFLGDSDGLARIKLTPGESFTLIDEWTAIGAGRYAHAVHVRWPYAYVVDSSADTSTANPRLRTVDLRTQLEVGSAIVLGSGSGAHPDIEFYRDHLYITGASQASVFILNVATPSAPALVTTLSTVNQARGLSVVGARLFVSVVNSTGSLRVYSLTTPSSPSLLATWPQGAAGNWIEVSGSYLFTASSPQGAVLEVEDVSDINLAGFAGNLSYAEALAVAGKHMVLRSRDEVVVVELE